MSDSLKNDPKAARPDVLIIGGGPGGSTAATFLRQKGHRVLVLEKEVFPRFHIGESLLPYNREIFEELGVWPALQAQGFPRKLGAQFYIGNGSRATRFLFANGVFTKHTEAIHVERAKFDHILLQHARAAGAEVREGWTVTRFGTSPAGVEVEATDPAGEKHRLEADFLIDASGRGNLTANQEGLRTVHPRLKKLAVFGHFTGVQRDAGESGGDIIIVRLADKWFWIIPLDGQKTSVGCVMEQQEFAAAKRPPLEQFEAIWRSSPVLQERLAAAQLAGPIHTTSDFSYSNKRCAGERLLRVGDAAGFMDPIFSAGVFLAMNSGKMAAEAVDRVKRGAAAEAAEFGAYEKRVRAAMEMYWEMVENFYTTPFLEVFFRPRERFQLASAVNATLAGSVEGGWKLRWRMRLFFLLVKAQARFGFLPRISFEPNAAAGAESAKTCTPPR